MSGKRYTEEFKIAAHDLYRRRTRQQNPADQSGYAWNRVHDR
jgi:hypothetical protein